MTASRPETIIHSLSYPSFTIDNEGTISDVNGKWCELIGRDQDSLIGSDWSTTQAAFVSGYRALSAAVECVCNTDLDGSEQTVTALIESKTARRQFTTRVTPLIEGETNCGALVLFDESAPAPRRLTNGAETDCRFSYAFENHSAPMLLIDPETGIIENANAAAVEFYGYSRDTLTAMTIQDINCLGDAQVAQERARAREEDQTRFQFEHTLASGEIRPVEVQTSPVKLADGEVLFSIIYDKSEHKLQQEALKQERALSATILNTLDDIFCILDENGDIQRWNDRLEAVTGYDAGELSTIPVAALLTGEEQETVTDVIVSAIEQGDSVTKEVRLKTKAGEHIPYEFTVTPLPDERESLAVACVGRDTTERKQRERSLKQLRQAVEATPHAIFITDETGEIEYVNPAFEAMTGYGENEVLGKTPRLLKSEEHDQRYYEELWGTVLAGDVWRARVINKRRSGEHYHADQTIAPITEDNEIVAFVAIQTEVTGREERQQHFRVLSRVLRHNLQNDLSVIRSYAEQIKETGTHDAETEQIVKKTDDILKTARKERDIAAVLSEETRRRECDIVALIKRACADVQAVHPNVQLNTELPSSGTAIATERLRGAIVELIENAIEHSGDSVEITVSLAEADEHVEIVVADTGPGIPRSEQEMLETGAEIDQLYHGSGLGLWLVYWLVRQCGGTLTFTENEPQGSIVTIRLQRERTVETTGYVVEQ